jgi:hypothetical protein
MPSWLTGLDVSFGSALLAAPLKRVPRDVQAAPRSTPVFLWTAANDAAAILAAPPAVAGSPAAPAASPPGEVVLGVAIL